MAEKLSAEQAQRAEQIQQFIKTAEHVQRLVAELEANRNQAKTADNICHSIARETSQLRQDRKSTRLNSSHLVISYAVFCLKKKKNKKDENNDYSSTITLQ